MHLEYLPNLHEFKLRYRMYINPIFFPRISFNRCIHHDVSMSSLPAFRWSPGHGPYVVCVVNENHSLLNRSNHTYQRRWEFHDVATDFSLGDGIFVLKDSFDYPKSITLFIQETVKYFILCSFAWCGNGWNCCRRHTHYRRLNDIGH